MSISTVLAFVILLVASSSSQAQYNEAMCILLKQQINEYSQGNPNYRRAVRIYDQKCNNPKPIKNSFTNTKNIQSIESEPDNSSTKTQIDEESYVSEDSKTPMQLEQVANTSEVKVMEPPKLVVEQAKGENTNELANSAASSTLQQDNIEQLPQKLPQVSKSNVPVEAKVTESEKQKNITPIAVKQQNIDIKSYLIPTLLVIVLITLIVMRARSKRHNEKEEQLNAGNSDDNKYKNDATKPTSASISSKVESYPESADDSHKHTFVLSNADHDLNDEFVENEIDYPVFEPQALVPKEHNFKEPQVRAYDPDRNEVENIQISNINKNSAFIASQEVSSNESTGKIGSNELTDMENESVQASLNEISKSELSLDKPTVPSKGDEGVENPFANLSLDPSWDPENDLQPSIPEPKTGSKSQALIDAQERAKQFKTDND